MLYSTLMFQTENNKNRDKNWVMYIKEKRKLYKKMQSKIVVDLLLHWMKV
jgi:hypothetical protein